MGVICTNLANYGAPPCMKISVFSPNRRNFPSQVTTSDRSWNSLGRLMGSDWGVGLFSYWLIHRGVSSRFTPEKQQVCLMMGLTSHRPNVLFLPKGHTLWECDMMDFFDIPYEMGWGFISNDGEYPSGIPSSYMGIIWNFECDGL